MGKRRWVYRNGEAVEVSADYTPPRNYDHLLYNDRLYQDDGDPRYNSRKEHRQYMADNGLSMHSDYTQFYKDKAKEREKHYMGIDPSRKLDVAQAVRTLEQRRR